MQRSYGNNSFITILLKRDQAIWRLEEADDEPVITWFLVQ